MKKSKDICLYIFGSDNGVFEKIFQNSKKNKEEQIIKDYGNINKRVFNPNVKDNYHQIFKKFNLSMIGHKFPELNLKNSKRIILDAFNILKQTQNKKNIILIFGKSFIKEFSSLINRMESDKPFMLFIIENNVSNVMELFKSYKHPQYISYMIDCSKNETDKYYCKIITYILEKNCYYNELGNKYNKYFPSNFLYKEPKGFLYFNILLTGESRAGKSCFTNRIFNKLISYETSKLVSATLEINSYEFYPSEETKINELKKGYGVIRIFDTPGLVKTKELNSFNLIKDKLSTIFNKIHAIFFFIKAQSNIEQCIDMLKYIKDINLERAKNNKNKIPIIFIKNGEDLNITEEEPTIFQDLKNELTKHNLIELYDSSVNKNIEVKNYNVDNFFEKGEKNDNKYEKYTDGNIIQVHILTGKNMDKIFSTTQEYMIRNNDSLINSDFSSLKNHIQKLINFYIKEKLENKSLTYEEKKELN